MLFGGETSAPLLASDCVGGWRWALGGSEGPEEGCGWVGWGREAGGIWLSGVEVRSRGLGERRNASKSTSTTPTPRPKSDTSAGGRKSSIDGLEA
jgi:hypothetical protein